MTIRGTDERKRTGAVMDGVAGSGYRRIACLSTEAVEVLYRLGAQDRVAGISGYSVHPPEARAEKWSFGCLVMKFTAPFFFNAKIHPRRPALMWIGGGESYAQLAGSVLSCASALHEAGITRDDIVIIDPDTYEIVDVIPA